MRSSLYPPHRPGCLGSYLPIVLLTLALAQVDASAQVYSPQRASTSSLLRTVTTDDIGGDDVIMTTQQFLGEHSMDMDSQGRIFVAVRTDDGQGYTTVSVLRSIDAGDSWQLWGLFEDTPSVSIGPGLSLHVAEGASDLVFVAYSALNLVSVQRELRVAWSDLDLPTGSFLQTVVHAASDQQLNSLHLSSDEAYRGDYTLYLAMELEDSSGSDIWFTRSLDEGYTWESAYTIGFGDASGGCATPNVCYSPGGYVHVAWTYRCESGPCDYAIRYRRATGFAGAGSSSWGPVYSLSPSDDGLHQLYPSIAADSGSSLLMTYMVVDLTDTFYPVVTRYSSDSGTTWPPNDMGALSQPGMLPNAHWLETASMWCVSSFRPYSGLYGFEKAPAFAPLDWGGAFTFSDHPYPTAWIYSNSSVVDPRPGGPLAMLWCMPEIEGSLDGLYFDAEWRAGPGYPNLEDGFPRHLTSAPMTDPALADIGGSPTQEIVFTDYAGNVQVIQHDGEPLPGWPVVIYPTQPTTSLAIGDLNGDGIPAIVVGENGARVLAFAPGGELLPGWPVWVPTVSSIHVSIGALGPPYHRYVLAADDETLLVLNYRGEEVERYTFATPLVAAASIGDVDDDGVVEFVTVERERIQVFSRATTAPLWSYYNPNATFSEAPALGDLDLDGDLEIVTVGESGRVMVWHHDLTPYGGAWPFQVSPLAHMNPPALANVLGGSEPEIVASSKDGYVYLLYDDGSVQSGYPHQVGNGWLLSGTPVLGRVDRYPANVVVGVGDMHAYSWDNFGNHAPGWPKLLDTRVYTSPACGDIDLDGRNEFVFAGETEFFIVDVNYPPGNDPYRNWTMYGFDAQRTNCLDCPEDLITAVPGYDGSTRLEFKVESSNPNASSFTFCYELPRAAAVRLSIYDVMGRRLRRMTKSELGPGEYRDHWDGRDDGGNPVASGTYYARLQVAGTGQTSLVRKVTVLR